MLTLVRCMLTSCVGHVTILEWMLHHSLATGLERDDFGATPIHDAADNNQLECLHAFYKHGLNLEPKDNEGMTPFDLAQEKQHIRCIQFLLCPQQSFDEARRKSRDVKVRMTPHSMKHAHTLIKSFLPPFYLHVTRHFTQLNLFVPGPRSKSRRPGMRQL